MRSGALARAAGGAALLALLSLGCARFTRPSERSLTLELELGRAILHLDARDVPDAAGLEQALRSAARRLVAHGSLTWPVDVWLVSAEELRGRARYGHGWLRAWARHDELFLLAPRLWPRGRPTPAALEELLTHELAHVVMFQLASEPARRQTKAFPAWFREGFASVAAGQRFRWPSLEGLARIYEAAPDEDPLLRPEAFLESRQHIAYGAAHHAYHFFTRRYGQEATVALLARMRAGDSFEAAFATTTGAQPEAFARDFKRYVRLRGFRAAGRSGSRDGD